MKITGSKNAEGIFAEQAAALAAGGADARLRASSTWLRSGRLNTSATVAAGSRPWRALPESLRGWAVKTLERCPS